MCMHLQVLLDHQLGQPMRADRVLRRILGRRDGRTGPINGAAGADKDITPHTCINRDPHRLHMRDHVFLNVADVEAVAEARAGGANQLHHRIHALQRRRGGQRIAQIGLDHLAGRAAPRSKRGLDRARDGPKRPACGAQPCHQVTAQKPARAEHRDDARWRVSRCRAGSGTDAVGHDRLRCHWPRVMSRLISGQCCASPCQRHKRLLGGAGQLTKVDPCPHQIP